MGRNLAFGPSSLGPAHRRPFSRGSSSVFSLVSFSLSLSLAAALENLPPNLLLLLLHLLRSGDGGDGGGGGGGLRFACAAGSLTPSSRV
ncbi:hypothetical protein NL676_039400 [Syzygium grande]|nr:hypothetical protein NL676_039400 [Syzygium grande]